MRGRRIEATIERQDGSQWKRLKQQDWKAVRQQASLGRQLNFWLAIRAFVFTTQKKILGVLAPSYWYFFQQFSLLNLNATVLRNDCILIFYFLVHNAYLYAYVLYVYQYYPDVSFTSATRAWYKVCSHNVLHSFSVSNSCSHLFMELPPFTILHCPTPPTTSWRAASSYTCTTPI